MVFADTVGFAEFVPAGVSVALCTSATMGVNETATYCDASAPENVVFVLSVAGLVPMIVRRLAEMVVP